MPAVLIQIADAVVAKLNQAGLKPPFTAGPPLAAVRAYTTELDLKDIKHLVLTVVPKEDDSEPLSRSQTADTYRVDIAVRRKIDPQDTPAVDALMNLVQEIKSLFRFGTLADYPQAAWTGTENNPAWFPGHLRELRQFTSVVTLTYELVGK